MKILFTGGGTAGHVTPNIALIEQLHTHADCYYMGSDGMEKQLLEPLLASGKLRGYYTINPPKLNRKLSLKLLAIPFQLMSSVNQAKRQMAELCPDVVFGKGGYVSLPVAISARKLSVPIILHESDTSMGLANKLARHYADCMLSTFPNTKHCLAVGAIIRPSLYNGNRNNGLRTMGFSGTKPVLLVMGGSLGAGQINDLIASSSTLAETFDIFVITGKNKSINCNFVKQVQFASNMGDIYRATTIAITRGGANSLTELVAMGIPFVTIPLEKNSRGEQIENARYFASHNCCEMLTGEVTANELIESVNKIYQNLPRYKENLTKFNLDGTTKITEIIMSKATKTSTAN